MINSDTALGNRIMSEDITFFTHNFCEDLAIEKKEVNFTEDDDPVFGGRLCIRLKKRNIDFSISFMTKGWLGIEAFDWSSKDLILNYLLEPLQHEEKRRAILHLKNLISSI